MLLLSLQKSSEIWANSVKHAKICTECHRKGKCLKGVDIDCKPIKPIEPRAEEIEEAKEDKIKQK